MAFIRFAVDTCPSEKRRTFLPSSSAAGCCFRVASSLLHSCCYTQHRLHPSIRFRGRAASRGMRRCGRLRRRDPRWAPCAVCSTHFLLLFYILISNLFHVWILRLDSPADHLGWGGDRVLYFLILFFFIWQNCNISRRCELEEEEPLVSRQRGSEPVSYSFLPVKFIRKNLLCSPCGVLDNLRFFFLVFPFPKIVKVL